MIFFDSIYANLPSGMAVDFSVRVVNPVVEFDFAGSGAGGNSFPNNSLHLHTLSYNSSQSKASRAILAASHTVS